MCLQEVPVKTDNLLCTHFKESWLLHCDMPVYDLARSNGGQHNNNYGFIYVYTHRP